jgi:hypothetical protein
MMVRMNPRQELREFYPPPYDFLARCPRCGQRHKPGAKCSRGMGQGISQDISQTAGGASSLIGSADTLLVAAGALQAVPVAGQIAGAVLSITAVIASFFKGCGSSCVLTSDEVNQVSQYMAQNLQQYLAAPVSAATQAEAIANFNQLWQGIVAYCGQPSMGSAGKNCISERQNGACSYKTSPGGWQQQNGTWVYVAPGANGSGSTCWNYFVGYLDPIQNDPRVAEAASSPAASSTAASGAGAFNLSSLLLPAAFIGGGILLLSLLGDS